MGKWKSIFLKWYLDDLTLKMSTTLLGNKPYLTLYMKVARSCKRRFCRLGRLARSCTLSTFLASEALQKCHVRWQYVKYGNIEDLHKSNFASVGIRFLNLERTPTLWLAFIHSSLMCLLSTRCSSMLTPRRLMSAVLSMTCALIVNEAWPLSFCELIVSNWNKKWTPGLSSNQECSHVLWLSRKPRFSYAEKLEG